MTVYHHILVAVDYSPQFPLIAQKAKAIAELFKAKLSFLHVLDNIPMPQTYMDSSGFASKKHFGF